MVSWPRGRHPVDLAGSIYLTLSAVYGLSPTARASLSARALILTRRGRSRLRPHFPE